MSFSRKEIVDSYVTKVGSGRLDYSQIAAELKAPAPARLHRVAR